MKIGDYVMIKGDESNFIYKIKEYNDSTKRYFLSGVEYRIIREEEESNLLPLSNEDVDKEHKRFLEFELRLKDNLKKKIVKDGIIKLESSDNKPSKLDYQVRNDKKLKKRYVLGTIMHIDGDEEYLKKCLELYDEIGIYSYGKCVKEDEIHNSIGKFLLETNADIVVITGHDIYNNKGIKDLNNYSNTKNFIKAVKEIRKVRSNSCIVIAGACQSNFEALVANGADFASSPSRINIHTFDPAIIAVCAATTSISSIINIEDAFKYIENGKEAFGGLQTYGKMRLMV